MIGKKAFQKVLGENIRRIRIANNFSVEQLAYKSGLTYSQISRIELGKINPTAYTLFIISEALNVSTAEFLNILDENSI